MALALSNISLTPFTSNHRGTPSSSSSSPSPARSFSLPSTQKPTVARALSSTFESPPSITLERPKGDNWSTSSRTSLLDRQTSKVAADQQEVLEQLQRDGEHQLASRWREIHGRDEWAGMLDPMDSLLRSELIRYGEMAQACYDAFDFDAFSKYCGSCKYNRQQFFGNLGMASYGYDITRYLYATSNINLPNFFKKSRWPKVWSKNANWIGYVSVSNDETSKRLGRRDITISWRGTVTRHEWVVDLMDFLKPVSCENIPCPDPSVKVESGFVDLYTDKDPNCRYCKFSAREQILTEIKRLVEMYPDEELSITMTGHSLGSALATISAYDIAETGLHVRKDGRAIPICVYSFSGPRVGNLRFKERLERLEVKVLRVLNVHDLVPRAPGFFINEKAPGVLMKFAGGLPWSYSHVGVELALDHKNSPFLKESSDAGCAHNLEALLHLIDGYHGKGERFKLATPRDIALVNKSCDFLEDHHQIPPCWRQDENKGMIMGRDGRWMQAERPALDDHPEDMHHHLRHLIELAHGRRLK